MNLIGLLLGFTIGNFAAQFFGACHYEVALERTFFQGMALLAVYISMRLAA